MCLGNVFDDCKNTGKNDNFIAVLSKKVITRVIHAPYDLLAQSTVGVKLSGSNRKCPLIVMIKFKAKFSSQNCSFLSQNRFSGGKAFLINSL